MKTERQPPSLSAPPISRSGTLLVEHLPKDTKAAFKAACARRGRTMRDVIIQLMRAYAVQEDHK